jgi:predicted RNA-binding Zn-ribbon protein involved in translation (DUF1610 family)
MADAVQDSRTTSIANGPGRGLRRLAVLCLVMWAVIGVLCVRSQWRRDTLSWVTESTPIGQPSPPPDPRAFAFRERSLGPALAAFHAHYVESTSPGLAIWSSGWSRDNLGPVPLETHRTWQPRSAPRKGISGLPSLLAPARFLGFEYASIRRPNPRSPGETIFRKGLTIPWWFFMAGLSIAPAIWARRIGRRRKLLRLIKAGRCVNCGYDLRASVARCPECGQAILTSPSTSSPPPQSQTTPPPTTGPR